MDAVLFSLIGMLNLMIQDDETTDPNWNYFRECKGHGVKHTHTRGHRHTHTRAIIKLKEKMTGKK